MDATLQGIFRAGFDGYRKQRGVSLDQYRAAQAIMTCQSEALGHEEWACEADGHTERLPHSCRHRSCPRCHRSLTHDWLEATKARLLPCAHYHVVFTLPHELNPVWQYNRSWCSDRLFKATSETLQQLLADERYLGAQVGLLAALHTWGRTLSFHPHVHVLVTGGGLHGGEWRAVRNDFLLPVGVLKAKFRGKWLSWLNRAYDRGELQLPPDWSARDWRQVLRRIARKQWNIRIQGGYRHGRGVAAYLSRYVRGGPIRDRQLLQADETRVRFRYRSHHDGKLRELQLPTGHFLERTLWHVPVKGQHQLRYYGMYVPGATDKRDLVRRQLGEAPGEERPEPLRKERNCPACGRPLVHRKSVGRKISYIWSSPVQQGVEAGPADRDGRPPGSGANFFTVPGPLN